MPTYYSVLGVAQTADIAAISSSYKKLVLKTHPDKGGKAEEFIRVHDAYEVLSNVATRAAYDEELQKRCRPPPPPPRAPPPPPPPSDRANRSPFTTPPPRPVPNEYAFRRPRPNDNDNFTTGSPPPRMRRPRANAFFARDGPGADTHGNGQRQAGLNDPDNIAAMRAELDVFKRLSTRATNYHWFVEKWIRNLTSCVGADRLGDIMAYVAHFEVKLKQNMDMLALRQMTMTLIIGGGPAANMFPDPPPLDVGVTCRAMADLDKAVTRFQDIAWGVICIAVRLKEVQTGEADGAVDGNNPDVLNRRLGIVLNGMKKFLETVLFQKNCWFEERNRARTFGV
ncbi:hypothetical protein H2204_015627 [Knufia peltigerae]|uniref:J domain-containing protein n=1 Tax=Knufia peltigerae TaxID=1002370 RepID=A0AA38X9F6_9EURO|nr:hypothetical protein H2204_015627 [Knufia peltigerae]